MQVNISHRRRAEVCANIDRMSVSAPPSADIFDDANDEVFALMKSDSFMEFKSAHRHENIFE